MSGKIPPAVEARITAFAHELRDMAQTEGEKDIPSQWRNAAYRAMEPRKGKQGRPGNAEKWRLIAFDVASKGDLYIKAGERGTLPGKVKREICAARSTSPATVTRIERFTLLYLRQLGAGMAKAKPTGKRDQKSFYTRSIDKPVTPSPDAFPALDAAAGIPRSYIPAIIAGICDAIASHPWDSDEAARMYIKAGRSR